VRRGMLDDHGNGRPAKFYARKSGNAEIVALFERQSSESKKRPTLTERTEAKRLRTGPASNSSTTGTESASGRETGVKRSALLVPPGGDRQEQIERASKRRSTPSPRQHPPGTPAECSESALSPNSTPERPLEPHQTPPTTSTPNNHQSPLLGDVAGRREDDPGVQAAAWRRRRPSPLMSPRDDEDDDCGASLSREADEAWHWGGCSVLQPIGELSDDVILKLEKELNAVSVDSGGKTPVFPDC